MTAINPWINFNGNTAEAFNFYKSVFGGEFEKIIYFKDLKSAGVPITEDEENKILRIGLPIGNGSVLIGNDVPNFMGKVSENENRTKISLKTGTKEEADRLFNGLSAGGINVEGPMGDSPWNTYSGMFRDKYGVEWIIEFSPEK